MTASENIADNRVSAPVGTQPPTRLHWTALTTALLAFVTLYLSEGQSYILPLLILALLASAFTSFRLGKSSAPAWMLRLALWGTIIALNQMRPDDPGSSFFDLRLNWTGEMLASELVIQVWKRRPEGGSRGIVTLFLSGLTLLIACDISEDTHRFPYIQYLAPAYMLFAMLSLRHFAPPDTTFTTGGQADKGTSRETTPASMRSARLRRGMYALAVALALGMGIGGHRTFRVYRSELTYWGMRFLNERQGGRPQGLSTTPRLGATDNLKGSAERALRIEGEIGDPHWRVLAFSRYALGGWGPSRNSRDYRILPTGTGERVAAQTPHTRVVVTRLIQNNGLLPAPLNALALDPLGSGDINWAAKEGGPLLSMVRAPTRYALSLSRAETEEVTQGLFCASPDKTQRARLLEFPGEIDPRVKQLAQTILWTSGGQHSAPRDRIAAVERYLITNYRYSLTYHPAAEGDPLSVFLLNKGAAHCEYFAAAATILLRCLGIPTRYMVGYFAHEGGGPGVTIIRQRDAHAWAECWVDGQGWTVVDATPGNGRPDQLAGPIPWWQRAREWIQDTWSKALDWLSGPGGAKAAIALGAGAFLALAWQWRQGWRAKREPLMPFAYASPDAELAALAAQFERFCRMAGLACSPELTWQEYLASPTARATVEAGSLNIDLEKAQAFVRAYNAARFGAMADRETLAELKTLLAQAERKNIP